MCEEIQQLTISDPKQGNEPDKWDTTTKSHKPSKKEQVIKICTESAFHSYKMQIQKLEKGYLHWRFSSN